MGEVESACAFHVVTWLNAPHIPSSNKKNMEQINKENSYTRAVDFFFLKEMGIRIVMYQEWQIGLFMEELKGKFIWYPKKGTLMYNNREKEVNRRIGNSGDFRGVEDKTEDVYHEIMKELNNQQEL